MAISSVPHSFVAGPGPNKSAAEYGSPASDDTAGSPSAEGLFPLNFDAPLCRGSDGYPGVAALW